MSLSDVATWAQIAADSALVASVLLLAYNLWATRKVERRNLAFSMMQQLTSHGFAESRWKMHTAIPATKAAGWKEFDESKDDYECRSFAYHYELVGQMVRAGNLDYALVRDFLQFTVVSDWNAFQPLDAHLRERYPGRPSPWSRFRELAERINADLHGPGILTGS